MNQETNSEHLNRVAKNKHEPVYQRQDKNMEPNNLRGARNRVGTELSNRPASPCSLAGLYDHPIPTRFLSPP
jgi:hypothetical protein